MSKFFSNENNQRLFERRKQEHKEVKNTLTQANAKDLLDNLLLHIAPYVKVNDLPDVKYLKMEDSTLRLSYFKLKRDKFTVRLEISKGW